MSGDVLKHPLNRYVEKGGKRMRYGYTTGSCATAASKAAALMLFTGEIKDTVEIATPKGWDLVIDLFDCRIDGGTASCAVVKDSGDDPDVTKGTRVYAAVRLIDDPGVVFKRGKGLGVVTLPGLSIPVGEPAINPTPRAMMRKALAEVAEAYDYTGGFEVTISLPEGEELAKRTFNPKLGVQGGLSILGTTGIVTPMSEESLKASMRLELSVLKEKGCRDILFVPGNYGADFAAELGLKSDRMVKISNFVGYMFERAENMGIARILFVGHLGKLVKVAGGIFQTHSSYSDARMEILAAYAALDGADQACVSEIMHCTTTDDAVETLRAHGFDRDYFDHLAERVKIRCERKVYQNIAVEVVLFSRKYGLLGQTKGAAAFEALFK